MAEVDFKEIYPEKRAQSFQQVVLSLTTPTEITGREVTIAVGQTAVEDPLTDDLILNDNMTVDGTTYYGYFPPDVRVLVLTATFIADSSNKYYFEKVPFISIKNKRKSGGRFTTVTSVSAVDAMRNPIEYIVELYFEATDLIDAGVGINYITFEGGVVQTPTATTKVHSASIVEECSNIVQNLDLSIIADSGAAFKVTCTGSDGTSNVIPDTIHTVSETSASDFGPLLANVENLPYIVRVPIPAKSSDVNWTVTIVPESGTANGADIAAMTVAQKGLKTITFQDDVSGISNTTFPDKVVTYVHGKSTGDQWQEREDNTVENKYQRYKNISIVITASSGTLALKEFTPRPTVASSFTNITSNNIIVTNISTKLDSSSQVTLSFQLYTPNIEANIVSAIKLSDFLTNS